MSEASILEALMVENRNKCKPPLAESEVRSIAHSCMRYPGATDQLVSGDEADPLAALRCVADVEAESVDWLWELQIPLRHLTGLEGDPGEGKSFITQAIATGLSCGAGLPGAETSPPSNTLLLTAEDYVPISVRPRLEAMGANLERVFAYDEAFSLAADGFGKLEELVARTSARLLVIDPIVAFLPAAMDIHRANEVRAIMAGLAALAQKCNCAVLIVRHLAKGNTSKAIYRGLGSIDFTAACRSSARRT